MRRPRLPIMEQEKENKPRSKAQKAFPMKSQKTVFLTKAEVPIKVQETYRTLKRLDQ